VSAVAAVVAANTVDVCHIMSTQPGRISQNMVRFGYTGRCWGSATVSLLYITDSEIEATAACAVRVPLAVQPVAHAACNFELGYL